MIYEKVTKFYQRYALKNCVIGYTAQGRNIYAFHVGSDYGKQFIAVYAVHAREYITALLALRHIREGVSGGGWVIPLLNPDGVCLCENGYPMWKANGRGVDLNCNFNACWGTGRLNTRRRGSDNWIAHIRSAKARLSSVLPKGLNQTLRCPFTQRGAKYIGSLTARGTSAARKLSPTIRVTPQKKLRVARADIKIGAYKNSAYPHILLSAATIDFNTP